MIIVKTDNGTKFINEKEAVMVCHDKKAKKVSFHTRETMQGVTIHDVESVMYSSDSHPFEFKDEGSEIEKLKKELENEKRRLNYHLWHFSFVREWLFIYRNALETLSDKYKQADRNGGNITINPLAIIEEAERKYRESEKKYDEESKKWE